MLGCFHDNGDGDDDDDDGDFNDDDDNCSFTAFLQSWYNPWWFTGLKKQTN